MSGTNGNGHAPAGRELRRQLRDTLARRDLLRAEAESRLLESFAGPGFGPYQQGRDPFHFNWDFGPGVWLPLGHGGRTSDRQDGQFRPHVWTEQHLEWMRARAEWLATENIMAQGLLQSAADYVVGTGYVCECRPRHRFAKDKTAHRLSKLVQECVDEFEGLNNVCQREYEHFHASRVDGESIARFFPQRDGSTILRPVEACQLRQPPGSGPEWWGGIECDPHDIETYLAYHIVYDPRTPDEGEVVDGEDVAFLKLNVRRTVKRGLSDFYSTGDALDQTWRLLDTMVRVGRIQASLPWIEEFPEGTPQDALSALVGARRALNVPQFTDPITGRDKAYQQFSPGEIPMVGAGKKYVPQPSAGNVPNHVNVIQASLRALGARWGMPEFFTGDASNNNYASILVAGGPFVRRAEVEQKKYAEHFKSWRWIAVRNAARSRRFVLDGRVYDAADVERMCELTMTAPQVAIANKAEEAEIDHKDLEAGVISIEHRRGKLGVDSDKIEADLKKREKEHPEQPPGGQPGQPPSGPGKPPAGGQPPGGRGGPGGGDPLAAALGEGKDAAGHEHDARGRFGKGGGGGGGKTVADHLGVAGHEAVTAEHEAKLTARAGSQAGRILKAVAALPGKAVPARVQAAVAKVKDAVIGAMKRRYGERATGLILKAAAISAPVPLPGSQPLTIAISLVVAEGVRAWQKFRRPATAAVTEGVAGEMTADELHDAVREFLAELERQLQAALGTVTEGRFREGAGAEDLGDLDERAALIADVFYGLHGEQALSLLAAGNADEQDEGEDRPVSEGWLREAWNALDHPRGKGGRFIEKGSQEARAAAMEAVSEAVQRKGGHTPEQAEKVLEHLAILNVDQLKELHRQHGEPAPPRLRQQLVDGIKARLEAGKAPAAEPAAPVADVSVGDTIRIAPKSAKVGGGEVRHPKQSVKVEAIEPAGDGEGQVIRFRYTAKDGRERIGYANTALEKFEVEFSPAVAGEQRRQEQEVGEKLAAQARLEAGTKTEPKTGDKTRGMKPPPEQATHPSEMTREEFYQHAWTHGAPKEAVKGIEEKGWQRGEFAPPQDMARGIDYGFRKSGLNAVEVQAIKRGERPVPPERQGVVFVARRALPGEESDHPHSRIKVLGHIPYEDAVRDPHRAFVEAALAAGKPVPPEVLADYPDLAPPAAPAPAKPARQPRAKKAAGAAARPAGEPAATAATAPHPSTDPAGFADHVKDAAAALPDWSGKRDGVGPEWLAHKPQVAAVYDHLKAAGKLGDMSLDEFKGHLLKLHQAGHLRLARNDMAESAVDQDLRKRSQIAHLNATFDVVSLPGDEAGRRSQAGSQAAPAPAPAPVPKATPKGPPPPAVKSDDHKHVEAAFDKLGHFVEYQGGLIDLAHLHDDISAKVPALKDPKAWRTFVTGLWNAGAVSAHVLNEVGKARPQDLPSYIDKPGTSGNDLVAYAMLKDRAKLKAAVEQMARGEHIAGPIHDARDGPGPGQVAFKQQQAGEIADFQRREQESRERAAAAAERKKGK